MEIALLKVEGTDHAMMSAIFDIGKEKLRLKFLTPSGKAYIGHPERNGTDWGDDDEDEPLESDDHEHNSFDPKRYLFNLASLPSRKCRHSHFTYGGEDCAHWGEGQTLG